MRLLVIEDDAPLRDLLVRRLREEAYVVDGLPDGHACDAYLDSTQYDALILDTNLPHANSLAILRSVRKRGEYTPVLLLAARENVVDITPGLDAGADDYLCKPFAFSALEARLRFITRRPRTWIGTVLRAADIEMDVASRRTWRGDRELSLTPKERAFLEVLLRHSGQTVARKMLQERLWGAGSEHISNVLRSYASRLRAKLCERGEPRLVRTVRGIGYRIDRCDAVSIRTRTIAANSTTSSRATL